MSWIDRLSAAPRSERSALLEALVTSVFRAQLLAEEGEVLPLDTSFFALGLTSLGAVEVQERLEAELGRRIDSASLFNNPTIGQLLAHLAIAVIPELLAAPAGTAAATAPPPPAPPSALVAHMLDALYES
jgi:acyl carrier protein